MNRKLGILALLVSSFLAGFFINQYICNQKSCSNDEEINQQNQDSSSIATPEIEINKKVVGIGGIFFRSENSAELLEWYQTNLGMEMSPYGCRFEWQEWPDTSKRASLQWSLFGEEFANSYMQPSTKNYMINYRVGDINYMVEEFRKNGVPVLDTIATYPYGKFVHLMDPEGNKIELFEPNFDFKLE